MEGPSEADSAEVKLANDTAIRRFALVLAGAVVMALSFPQALFAATLSSFLSLGAGIVGTVALVAKEPVWADRLTRWDVAAGLYALGLAAGFFVDMEMIRIFLLEQNVTLP